MGTRYGRAGRYAAVVNRTARVPAASSKPSGRTASAPAWRAVAPATCDRLVDRGYGFP
jgi:hypothetical protein